MELLVRRKRLRPTHRAGDAGLRRRRAWDWDSEIAVAISMVARDPRYHVLVTASSRGGGALSALETSAASLGVVLERRIRPDGGWDVEVRAG